MVRVRVRVRVKTGLFPEIGTEKRRNLSSKADTIHEIEIHR